MTGDTIAAPLTIGAMLAIFGTILVLSTRRRRHAGRND
ncbi:LPXTG cell wall anchor domain-containing protein [Micromonospora sp. NPDC049374]